MKYDFEGKVALVTGASGGIGRATRQLAGSCLSSLRPDMHDRAEARYFTTIAPFIPTCLCPGTSQMNL